MKGREQTEILYIQKGAMRRVNPGNAIFQKALNSEI